MKCRWCETEIQSGKEYELIIPSDKKPFRWGEQIIADGHEYCLGQLKDAYFQFGKLLTQRESDLKGFAEGHRPTA